MKYDPQVLKFSEINMLLDTLLSLRAIVTEEKKIEQQTLRQQLANRSSNNLYSNIFDKKRSKSHYFGKKQLFRSARMNSGIDEDVYTRVTPVMSPSISIVTRKTHLSNQFGSTRKNINSYYKF